MWYQRIIPTNSAHQFDGISYKILDQCDKTTDQTAKKCTITGSHIVTVLMNTFISDVSKIENIINS